MALESFIGWIDFSDRDRQKDYEVGWKEFERRLG